MTVELSIVKPKLTPAQKVLRVFNNSIVNVVLAVVAIFWLVPTVGLLLTSLRSSGDNSASGWWNVFTAPAQLTLDNYANLLSNPTITGSFWNTVVIAVPTTALVVMIGALAGYAFAWLQFPGRDWLLIAVIVLLAVPIQVALIPLARLFGQLGIFGSVLGVILFHVAFGLPFAIFLLRNFFTQFPSELLEAARVDGASEWQIFFRMILPLGLPAIASLAIFQFLWTWNDMLVALIFTNAQSMPLTVAIQSQLRQYGSNIDVLSAGAFLSMIVPLIVFFAFQRYFVQALLAGSQK
ncbi:carbohydrate ABC transporter permease [Tessaracoccus sp. MC1865]|uniref:carbohydrate ABC transporter permease n=1 Tax=unclassified Tessaracoccus TaxID=2635419 RepID=UPI00096F4D0E|nr:MULTISPECIES: carbohydrate ABC transporter permease [unclassified Tessaracoccus]MBB1482694.1 carbohydrate ABC transporter permease [Tessaracoccus sp. MC1865]MBB1509886.1 carbohydrate ABC transporter permease [Tessaracoccus sp. MC1756]MCG6568304.1 carbohydrate ABC transporter permease [Tessaracoccus sp. ZS01]OMG53394.1 sugar ABC transporter permease [Tessaracoccus sp. ZS01]QTO37857.1 carbohydrate ABC transporter permease [Tessaracoccus sp. MC1865]